MLTASPTASGSSVVEAVVIPQNISGAQSVSVHQPH